MRVVVVAPHPDDEVLGCGGTIARHAAAGDEVHVVVMTRGAPEVFPAEQVAQVRQEAARAHEVLGVAATHYLDLPAPLLDTVPKYRQAAAIRGVLNEVRPEVVYLPHHGDIHHDHRETYMAVLVAARPLSGCPVRRLLCYETLSETEWAPPTAESQFCPHVFINIEPHLPRKLKAMSCFTSQLRDPPSSRSLQTIEALARFRGATVHLAAAEAFQLVRDITH